MSCVIGLVTASGVWLGSDSAASDGNIIIGNKFPKIFQKKVYYGDGYFNLGFGVSGSVHVGHAIDYFLEVPETKIELPSHEYVIKRLVPALAAALDDAGARTDSCDTHTAVSNCILVAFGGELYFVDHEFGVISSTLGYDAIGSGREVALGAIHALLNNNRGIAAQPSEIIAYALEAAKDLTAFVGGPTKAIKIVNGSFMDYLMRGAA